MLSVARRMQKVSIRYIQQYYHIFPGTLKDAGWREIGQISPVMASSRGAPEPILEVKGTCSEGWDVIFIQSVVAINVS